VAAEVGTHHPVARPLDRLAVVLQATADRDTAVPVPSDADRVVLQRVDGAVVERGPVGRVPGRVGRAVQRPAVDATVVAGDDVRLAVLPADRPRVLVRVGALVAVAGLLGRVDAPAREAEVPVRAGYRPRRAGVGGLENLFQAGVHVLRVGRVDLQEL